jgi:hypothetical protein
MSVFDTRDLLGGGSKVMPVLALQRTNSIFLKAKVDGNHYAAVHFSITPFTLSDCHYQWFFRCSADYQQCCPEIHVDNEVRIQSQLLLQKFFPQVCCDVSG